MNDLLLRLGAISEDDFEQLCCELFRSSEFPDWSTVEPGYNTKGKTRPGTPDAFVRRPDGQYVAFQFTTQQTRVKAKICSDIEKLASANCAFVGKIAEVVICFNTPLGTEQESYQAIAATHNWQLHCFSVHRLASTLQRHPDLCARFLGGIAIHHGVETTEERMFEAGLRLKLVREELELSTGEFVEIVAYPSERKLKAMEQGYEEVPITLLETVSQCTGVSLDWLKFNKGESQYEPSWLTVFNLQADIETLRLSEPKELYFCLAEKSLDATLLVKVTEYRWLVYDLGIALDFWNWLDDHYSIAHFYRLLRAVFDEFWEMNCIVSSRILSDKAFEDLNNGRIHPRKVFKEAGWVGRYWAEDLRDIYHELPSAPQYHKEHGRWFSRVQEWMRGYDDMATEEQLAKGLSVCHASSIGSWLRSFPLGIVLILPDDGP